MALCEGNNLCDITVGIPYDFCIKSVFLNSIVSEISSAGDPFTLPRIRYSNIYVVYSFECVYYFYATVSHASLHFWMDNYILISHHRYSIPACG